MPAADAAATAAHDWTYCRYLWRSAAERARGAPGMEPGGEKAEDTTADVRQSAAPGSPRRWRWAGWRAAAGCGKDATAAVADSLGSDIRGNGEDELTT